MGLALAVPLVILIQPGGGGAAIGGPTSGVMLAWDVQGYFEKMTPSYGGASWLVLSTQAASNLLKETGALLSSQYRVRYESLSDGQTPPKLEVRRKGVKFLAGPTQVEILKRH